MNHPTFRSSIFFTAMLAASAAFAGGADIVKCVDQDGKVTLTENQCNEGVQTVLVAGDPPAPAAADEAAGDTPAAPAPRRAIQRVAFTPAAVQHDSWTAPKSNGRPLSRDVETLKAARLSMQVMDEASAANRHPRLAGLN